MAKPSDYHKLIKRIQVSDFVKEEWKRRNRQKRENVSTNWGYAFATTMTFEVTLSY